MNSAGNNFPAAARLRARADFDRVFKTGRRSADKVFRVYACPTPGTGARLGLSVARAVAARAVARNRIKRQVRESFRCHRDALPAVDIVVQALSAAASAGNPDLRRSLEWHWRQLILRCAAS